MYKLWNRQFMCFQISQQTHQMLSLLMKLADRCSFWMCGCTFDHSFEEAFLWGGCYSLPRGCSYIMMVQGFWVKKKVSLHLFFFSAVNLKSVIICGLCYLQKFCWSLSVWSFCVACFCVVLSLVSSRGFGFLLPKTQARSILVQLYKGF